MDSTIRPGNGYTITIKQTKGLGSIWIVRTYTGGLLFRRVVSSDWFLDAPQAQRFAEQIAAEITSSAVSDYLRTRTPGWTFRRPAH
jgi:hypothetical protein